MLPFASENEGHILELAKRAAETGEPIVRSMEYEYPHQGFTHQRSIYVGGQVSGSSYGDSGVKRTVKLPKGKWKDERGQIFKGPKVIDTDVPLNRLPYYEKIK